MKTPETPGFGGAQQKKLADVLAEIRGFNLAVSIDDLDSQCAFALTGRDLVVRLQVLSGPILPLDTAVTLDIIHVDEHDLVSASRARAELDALVPAVEDSLAAVDSQAGTLLPGVA